MPSVKLTPVQSGLIELANVDAERRVREAQAIMQSVKITMKRCLTAILAEHSIQPPAEETQVGFDKDAAGLVTLRWDEPAAPPAMEAPAGEAEIVPFPAEAVTAGAD